MVHDLSVARRLTVISGKTGNQRDSDRSGVKIARYLLQHSLHGVAYVYAVQTRTHVAIYL